MSHLMEILEKVIEQIKKNNPYGLIFKGGTALSIFHLNHHRESEDLDFDVNIKYLKEYIRIQDYLIDIFEILKEKGIIKGYKIGKTGLASTNRFHMKIQFISYKKLQSKIDIDFVKPPKKLKKIGELYYYNLERMFISKVITFTERSDLKDFIDITYMLPKIDFSIFENKVELANLLERLLESKNENMLIEQFNFISRNVDLKVKGLRKGEMENLIKKTFRGIRAAINKLKY